MNTFMKAAATVAFAAVVSLSLSPAMAQGNPSGVRAGGSTIGGISVGGGGMKQGGGSTIGGISVGGGGMKQGGAMTPGGGIRQGGGGGGGVAIAPNNRPNRGLGDGRRRQAGNWAGNSDGRHYGNNHRRNRGASFYVYGAPYYNDNYDNYAYEDDSEDCRRYLRRYQRTGNRVWRSRYYNCIG